MIGLAVSKSEQSSKKLFENVSAPLPVFARVCRKNTLAAEDATHCT